MKEILQEKLVEVITAVQNAAGKAGGICTNTTAANCTRVCGVWEGEVCGN